MNDQTLPETTPGSDDSVKNRRTKNIHCPVVGIGASAGGLEAFIQLLKHLPTDTGMAFVLVQHLDPQHESALASLLARITSMPVREVTNNLYVKTNHVYVIPPNVNMSIARGVLKLTARGENRGANRTIDFFFEALAQDQGERAIGVILSGTATDGTIGLEAIKAEGGITFAQDDSAKYDSMPRNAIAAGCVDLVLSPKDIAGELGRIARHPCVASASGQPMLHSETEREAGQREGAETPLASGGKGSPDTGSIQARAEARKSGRAGETSLHQREESGFKTTLLLLRNHCNVDFSLYKSNTIQRRVTRRMVLNKLNTLQEYAVFLKGNATELDALYSDVLISVTSFFRNPEAFEALKRKVFPKLLQNRRDDPVRVWTLGCSTGQEAYSIAMSYVEAAENAPHAPKLQVFATDLNEALLEKARQGLYAKTLEQDVSPARLRRFFVEEQGGYRIIKSLREMVVFARQNLISDPPFSRMDLISCRNLMIYLEPDLQKKALPTFHYALKPEGFLFLGASESVGSFTDLFALMDKKHKIFSRKAAPTAAYHVPVKKEQSDKTGLGERSMQRRARFGQSILPGQPDGVRGELTAQREADRILANRFAPPGVVVNDELQILQFRGATDAWLAPPTGKASFDVLKMAREGLMLPLRAAVNKAMKENKAVRRENVRLGQNAGASLVNVDVIPLKNLPERCFLILFEPANAPKSGRVSSSAPSLKALPRREETRRLAETEHALAETRDFVQSLQEQHEASNEELQASNEEVQSANEELQSINEELETSKEELESTNEELTTVNEEMANRNVELSQLNNDLNNLHVSINTAILLLGRDLTIRRFTAQTEKIFNLLAADVGRPISGIRHNLDFAGLEEFICEVIDTVRMLEREVQDKGGRWYKLCARPYVTQDNKIDGVVLMLMDIDALKRSEQKAREAHEYADAVISTARDPLVVLRADLRVNTANDAFYKFFRTTPAQTQGRMIYELGSGQWNIVKLRQMLEEVLPRNSFFDDFEVTQEFPGAGRRVLMLNARRLKRENELMPLILLAMEDITERIESRAAMKSSEIRFRRLFEAAQDGILLLDPVNRKITDSNPYMTRLLGYTRQELLDKELWQIGLLKDEQASHAAFRELQQNGFIRYEDLPLQTKGGEAVQVEFVSSVYKEDGAKVIQCNVRDITRRKRGEDDLKAAIDNLQKARAAAENAIRAKDHFLAALSHELRTPLMPVLMMANALIEDERLPDNVREQLRMMERNIGLEARLIDDLLDITAISHGKLQIFKEPCDAHSLIGHASEIVRKEASAKEITIERNFTAKHFGLSADPTRLQQVIWNLMRNAIKFTPRGGRISLQTREQKAEDGTTWLRIEVTDSGVGIDPGHLEKIFLPFEQGALPGGNRFGGIGLGLAIAREVVQLHGGNISAQSKGLNQGATFIVELPGAFEPNPGGVDVPSTASGMPLRQNPPSAAPLRLLLVEDHESTLQTLSTLLERDGHHVVPTSNFSQALAAAEAEKFDLVISDLGLPDGPGTELMKQLNSAHGLRGIALSGYGMEENVSASRESGFIAHLIKPVRIAELRSVLASVPRV